MEEGLINDVGTNQTEEKILANEEMKTILNSIDKIKSNQQRKVIYLVDIEDMSYKEAAKILDISLPQVKMTLHRARKSLKKILEKEGM